MRPMNIKALFGAAIAGLFRSAETPPSRIPHRAGLTLRYDDPRSAARRARRKGEISARQQRIASKAARAGSPKE